MTCYEFVFPSNILLFPDEVEWASINLTVMGHVVRLVKPVAGKLSLCPPDQQSNATLSTGYTIFRFYVEPDPPDVADETLKNALARFAAIALLWVRVATRQYWLGITPAQEGITWAGSVVAPRGPMNFGSLRPALFLNFLTREMWQQIGKEVQIGHVPRVTEQMFCDGLLSCQNGNRLMAVTMLGIVAELELNELIRDLRANGKQSAQARRNKGKYKTTFEWKLKEKLPLLGARPFQGRSPTAADNIVMLYDKRGDAVHKGALSLVPGELGHYIYAMDDLLVWAREERAMAGCPVSGPTPVRISFVFDT